MPYGEAGRFASPAVPTPWTEPRELTERGPVCPQLPSRLVFVTGPVTDGLQRSEDCQVLSVTAPNDADGLPVMVWFHGGAYVSGSGESPKYDPDALVAEGRVVVVTVSYRLGIFGYCTPLGVDDDNLGLRDQLLALRVGPRQHRRIRWRPAARHVVRSVRGRRLGVLAAAVGGRRRSLLARDHPEFAAGDA